MRPTTRTVVVYVEDKPGVLNRVSSQIRRRAFNIESLTVGHTDRPDVSRMTLVIQADDDTARRLEAHLYKLVNVLRVEELGAGSVMCDLALIKVRAEQAARAEVLQLCEVFRARVSDVTSDALIVEITGPQDKLDSFVEVMRPFGILEMVRTGTIAMTRGRREKDNGTWPPSITTTAPTSI